MKRFHLIFILCILALLCSCADSPQGIEPTETFTPSENSAEAQMDVVICKINDSTIMRSDFMPVFEVYYQYYSQYMDMSNEGTLKELQDYVFNSLMRAEVVYQRAVTEGISLTQEDEDEVQKLVLSDYDALLEQAKLQAEQEGAQDIEARALELIDDVYLEAGLNVDTYKEKTAEQRRKSFMMEKLYAQVLDELSYTEQDAQAEYTSKLEQDRENFTQNPGQYEAALTQYDNLGGFPPLFVPEGYVRVKHILVASEEESMQMYQRLQDGEDFLSLMDEFGTDPGMKNEPNKTEGYLMGPDTAFDPKFKEAGFALENDGDYSEPFASSYDHGWHIVMLVEKVESKEIEFALVKDELMKTGLAAKQEEYFSQKIEEWIEQADITSYIGRIRDVGKQQ